MRVDGLTVEKFAPHHSAACLPAWPSKMAKKPWPRMPAKGTTIACASSMVLRGPFESVTAHLNARCTAVASFSVELRRDAFSLSATLLGVTPTRWSGYLDPSDVSC